MARTLYLTRAEVPAVIRGAVPGYRGPKWRVEVCESVAMFGARWDGGSKSTFIAVDLATGRVSDPDARAFGSFAHPSTPTVDLPVGVAIVEHAMFCGKDTGCTIYLRPENAAPLLPSGPQATAEQRAVLEATAANKSSYGGDREYRRHASGLTREVWDRVKAECQAAGWLTAAGAITAAGRNVRAAAKGGGKRRTFVPGRPQSARGEAFPYGGKKRAAPHHMGIEVTRGSGPVGRDGGTRAFGTAGAYAYEARVFPKHAADPAWELNQSQVSQLILRDRTGHVVFKFDRGLITPAVSAAVTEAVAAVEDALARAIFGRPLGQRPPQDGQAWRHAGAGKRRSPAPTTDLRQRVKRIRGLARGL